MNPTFRPSASEFDGLYNAPGKKRGDLRTIPAPPHLSLAEMKEVSAAVYDVLCRFANQYYFTPEEVRTYYRACVSEQLSDRTVEIGFLNPGDWTADLIDGVQRLLRSSFPLWRAVAHGTTRDTTIVVYPDKIRYGETSSDEIVRAAFDDLARRELAAHGVPDPAVVARRAALSRLVEECIRRGGLGRVQIVAAFRADYDEGPAVGQWMMCPNATTPALDVHGMSEIASGTQHHVKDTGDFGWHVPDTAPYRIQEWLFPGDVLPARIMVELWDANYDRSTQEVDLIQVVILDPAKSSSR